MNIHRLLLFYSVIMCFLLFPVIVSSDDTEQLEDIYQQGMTQYKQGNLVEAVYHFNKAANQGYADAQNQLGLCFLNGQGVPQDSKRAVHWFYESAERNSAEGQYNLGMRFYRGEGVPPDLVLAYQWFSLAADQGHQEAAVNRSTIIQKLSATELAEARRLVSEWHRSHK